jgi:Family of unknown function (DUF6334)
MPYDDEEVKPSKLNFEPEDLCGESIRSVFGRGMTVFNNGQIAFEEIAVTLDSCILVFSVGLNIAELLVRAELDLACGIEKRKEHNLSHHFGSEVSKMWFAKDSNGYKDIVIFSFPGTEHSIALISGASDVELSRVEVIKQIKTVT